MVEVIRGLDELKISKKGGMNGNLSMPGGQ
jgi:hypothetical protein